MKLRINDYTYDIDNVIDLGQLQTGEKRIKITLSVKTDDVSSMMGVFSCLPEELRIEEDDTFNLIRQLNGYTKAYDFQYNAETESLSVIVQEQSALEKIETAKSEIEELRELVDSYESVITALSGRVTSVEQSSNLIQSQISNLENNLSSLLKKN